jgi:enoyl-CoA hydratase/carnithine racemase
MSAPDPTAVPGTGPSTVLSGETATLRLDGGIAELALHREPCNEIGEATVADLERVVAWIRDGAGGARALVVRSDVARGFSAGADLRALYAGLVARREAGVEPSRIVADVRAFLDRIHAVFDALDTAPLTTVAAVHGVCFGGGLELALVCDVIVADRSARFAFPELRLGLVPGFGGIPRLSRDVGNGLVRDLLLTGRSINAQRAHALGLVAQVVGAGQAPTVARAVAAQAARFDAAATRTAKAFAKPLPAEWLAREKETFCALLASPVVEAALRRFVTSNDARPYLP